MIVLMLLLEKNDDYAIYSCGYEEKNLDGKIKIDLRNPKVSEVLIESKDERVGRSGTMRALVSLIKAAESNTLEERMCYHSS